MNRVSELRRVLAEEMTRLQAPPGLESRVLERALQPFPAARASRGGGSRSHIAARLQEARFETPVLWPRVIALIAALLAVLIVGTLVMTTRALQPTRTVPVQHGPPAGLDCEAPSDPGASPVPVPAKMVSRTTGWAAGAMRTTDGGAHWANVKPPSVPNRSSGYSEFFLDATHAWVAQAAGSSSACSDHIATFRTADGGQTWQQAPAIPVAIADPSERIWMGGGRWLDFVDADNGWLLVGTGTFDGPRSVGPLYRTSDGGLHWTMVSRKPEWPTNPGCQAGPGISFSSRTTGWLPLRQCANGELDTALTFLVTRDGGQTWAPQVFARCSPCYFGLYTGPLPDFIDGTHGFLLISGIQGHLSALVATSDGGETWSSRMLPFDGATEGILNATFIDPSQGWVLLASNTTGRVRIEVTSDGGNSWKDVGATLPTSYQAGYGRLDFVDAMNGFFGTIADLYATADGGRTWTVVKTTVT